MRAEDKADATQDDSEGEDNETQQEDDVFYLRYRTDVVGIQHYNGLVGPGEIVSLVSLVSVARRTACISGPDSWPERCAVLVADPTTFQQVRQQCDTGEKHE